MKLQGKKHLAFILTLCLLLLMVPITTLASADSAPTFTQLKLDMLGRVYNAAGGTNYIAALVSADGENFTEVAQYSTNCQNNTPIAMDLTEAVANVTGSTVYVKVKFHSSVGNQCALQAVKISGTTGNENKEFVNVDYTSMAAESTDYQNGLEAYNLVKLASLRSGTTDISLHPTSGGSIDAYIVFKIEGTVAQPDPEPTPDPEPVTPTFTQLKLDMLGRVYNGEGGTNYIAALVSADGENFTEVAQYSTNCQNNTPIAMDLTEAVANVTGSTVYVKVQFHSSVGNQCALQAVKISGTTGNENKEFVNVDYTSMAAESTDYQNGLEAYNLVKLASLRSGTTDISLHPTSGGSIDAYIVFKIDATAAPQPDPDPSPDPDPDPEPTPTFGSSVEAGYSVSYTDMENGSLDWQADVYDTSGMKVFFDAGDSVTMFCPDSATATDKTGYVTYKVTGKEGADLGLMSVNMVGRVFNKDVSSENFYLAVDYSLDDGATWKNARTLTSVHTTGKKNQNYTAVLGNIEQSSALVRVTMRSDYQDWVGIKSLKIAPPASVKPGFTENFGGMRPGATGWQKNTINFNLATLYVSNEGYTSLTTDMSSTSQGRSTIDYLIVAEEGKTLDGLVADMIGRLYDKSGDVNRGITFYYSDDYGVTFTKIDQIRAGAVTAYGQDMSMDLAEIAEGKTDLFLRMEINSKYWDWVSIETLRFGIAGEDYDDPGLGGEDDDDDDSSALNPGIGDDDESSDGWNEDDEWDDGWDDDSDDSPATGDTFSVWAVVVVLFAGLMLVLFAKKRRA